MRDKSAINHCYCGSEASIATLKCTSGRFWTLVQCRDKECMNSESGYGATIEEARGRAFEEWNLKNKEAPHA